MKARSLAVRPGATHFTCLLSKYLQLRAFFPLLGCCCLLPSAVVPLRLKKKPFDGGKNFFRRGYIDLRMHEEGVRVD
jgi:hypothetical protein